MRRKGTQIFELFRAFCRRNNIEFQSVHSSAVDNLSRFFWVRFYHENEVCIYNLRKRENKNYHVANLVDLLAVLCDSNYKILDSKYLSDLSVISRPLHYYEIFHTPVPNCSISTYGQNIIYSYTN